MMKQLAVVKELFIKQFGSMPKWAVAAPGRVNLIGEHTDYNDGFVLPIAIERQTVVVAKPNGLGIARIVSTHQPDAVVEFSVEVSLAASPPAWSNYVKGVVKACLDRGDLIAGFDAVIDTNVPIGGGLSSSAALEVAVATLIESMTGRAMDPMDKAKRCQWAEHHFAGMPCGIMDQAISVMGKQGHALLLDCRDGATKHIALDSQQVTVLIANSNVKHELTGSEYPQRRQQCELAAKKLGVRSLRDACLADLERAANQLDEVIYRRAKHVIGEIERTQQASKLLASGQFQATGELMYASHASLRDLFEVSTEELDLLVELTQELGVSKGVWGSRMTGGGFGGCTVSLVSPDVADEVAAYLQEHYQRKTGISPTIFSTYAGKGAHRLDLDRP